MTETQARMWLEQVDGDVYRNKQPDDDDSWVAVVRTPAPTGSVGKIIVAFGESFESATRAAEEQWQRAWSHISAIH